MNHPLVPISWGEAFDKLTILAIKKQHLTQPEALQNVIAEYDLLADIINQQFANHSQANERRLELQAINQKLWQIEDDLRECERQQDFGEQFVALARSVYFTNDERARIKREINVLVGSDLLEEKSYHSYR